MILVGDLVFRNNLISFVVKGLDLIDENVEKFGELQIECVAACATTRNSRNLPDYGMEARDLYKPFLTRDMVLSLCEKYILLRILKELLKYLKNGRNMLSLEAIS